MPYLDGFIVAVPTANKEKFIEHSKICTDVLMECGALSVVDSWGDEVPDGKITSMPLAVQKKDDETVCFSWITWPSKDARAQGYEKMKKDPRMNHEFPFDGKRLIYGSFEIVEHK